MLSFHILCGNEAAMYYHIHWKQNFMWLVVLLNAHGCKYVQQENFFLDSYNSTTFMIIIQSPENMPHHLVSLSFASRLFAKRTVLLKAVPTQMKSILQYKVAILQPYLKTGNQSIRRASTSNSMLGCNSKYTAQMNISQMVCKVGWRSIH